MPINERYDYADELFGNGDLSWRDHNFRVILIDTTQYTVNLASHRFLSDVPIAARIATSGVLTGKQNVGGVLDAANVTLYSVSGNPVRALIIVRDTGTAATSPLVCYLESFTVNGGEPPYEPDGSDVVVKWSDGENKIMRI